MTRLYSVILTLVAVLAVSSFALVSGVVADPPAAKNFVAPLKGEQEAPPVDTNATGLAKFQLSADGTVLSYKLIVANIDNVVASHIHIAPAGQNGSVVLFLYGSVAPGGGPSNGILAQGTKTAANLVGSLAGQPLSDLISLMSAGNAYVNVHTNDGEAPPNTGPGDFPGGEIRGQIQVAGPQ